MRLISIDAEKNQRDLRDESFNLRILGTEENFLVFVWITVKQTKQFRFCCVCLSFPPPHLFLGRLVVVFLFYYSPPLTVPDNSADVTHTGKKREAEKEEK